MPNNHPNFQTLPKIDFGNGIGYYPAMKVEAKPNTVGKIILVPKGDYRKTMISRDSICGACPVREACEPNSWAERNSGTIAVVVKGRLTATEDCALLKPSPKAAVPAGR